MATQVDAPEVFSPDATQPGTVTWIALSFHLICWWFMLYCVRNIILRGKKWSWRDPMLWQTVGWILLTLDMGLVTFATATYLSCPQPYVHLIPPLHPGPCYFGLFLRITKGLSMAASMFLVISVCLRFQPIYETFLPVRWRRFHRLLYGMIAVLTLGTLVSLSLGSRDRDHRVVNPRSPSSRMEKLEKYFSLTFAILMLGIHQASALLGIRFVMRQFKENHSILHPTSQESFGGEKPKRPESYWYLRLTYLFLTLNALTALLYLSLKLFHFSAYEQVPYVVRNVFHNVIVKSNLISMMLAMNTLGWTVSYCAKVRPHPNATPKSPTNPNPNPASVQKEYNLWSQIPASPKPALVISRKS
jgi:hypothetical protein